MSLVAIAGSRSLSPSVAHVVARVVRALHAAGRSLVLGDCVGADAFALTAALSLCWPRGGLRLCCVGGRPPDVGGYWSGSNVAGVRAVLSASCPVAVCWYAGGPVVVPLRARLHRREAVVVGTAAGAGRPGSGLVAFFGPDARRSRGTALAVRLAVGWGLPVVAFGCGCPPAALPCPVAGDGRPVPRGAAGAFRFVPFPF